MRDTLTPGSYGQLELRLLRRASFAATYLPQVIDFIVREVTGSEFTRPCAQEAVQIHSRLVRYTVHGQPGARELARSMLNVRHAVGLVQHEHYRASAVPGGRHDSVVSGGQLLRHCVAAGRERALPARGGALVIAEADGASTVYRPVSAVEARAIQVTARNAKEEAIRLHEQVVEALAPHVVMADWSRDEGYGVAVDVAQEAVTVQWWPASLPQTWALWERGGIRELCVAMLSPSWRVTPGAGQSLDDHPGMLHISIIKCTVIASGRAATQARPRTVSGPPHVQPLPHQVPSHPRPAGHPPPPQGNRR
ncbi:hypothetical protein [Streptomyces graminilatus]|uniref:hypothetical protein n=1 Tax=Streptomyces graminilatus TaxID=1464070 RepID=UPI0006E35D52|nr:hypothetical protein [Streptomyces graminilatus]